LINKLDPQRFADAIGKKAEKLEAKLVEKSMKVLNKMQQQEEKIYKKLLSTKDSLEAKTKLAELREKYSALKNGVKSPAIVTKARQYIPKLDSFNTALKFLDENGMSGKVKNALAKTELLKSKFQQAEEIKKFIKQRREQLKQQLEKLGMVKQLKQINKQIYYFNAQVKEYKAILNDPKKIEKKALELLSKTKWFQDFFKKNSMLASLFRMQGDLTDPAYLASLSGLQTRVQVQALVQQQIRGGGPNGVQLFQQQIQSAQSQTTTLQNRVRKFGGSNSDDVMPEGFKPNNEKTKSFMRRLEYGTNLQTGKGNSFWPNSADVALSVGYKLNQKSIIGIGASYKLGLGRGWQDLRLTSEGMGLRSFVDIKLKGSFWISGGFEANYRAAFNRLDVLKDFSAWQRSGLIGVSKSMPFKSKIFKKAKVQLLWDIMATSQVPRGQPIVFRVGYNFK
jgi:hypothetical protein